MKKISKLFFALLLMMFSMVVHAQCPVGATTLNSNTLMVTINSGQTYCATSNINLAGGLTIKQGGKLYIAPGVEVTGNGNFVIEGELYVQDGGGIMLSGSMTIGEQGKTTTVILGKNLISLFREV